MVRTYPFESYADRYDEWFEKNPWVYEAELRAVKGMVPVFGRGLEVGVGTGRFAKPLGIREGVEPSRRMGEIARRRGIHVLEGVAEQLPVGDSTYDFVLIVTTLCFVEDVRKALLEAHRVLGEYGILVVGFIDRNSKLGKRYRRQKNSSLFYKDATFLSIEEVAASMNETGFGDLLFSQTIFEAPEETLSDEPVRPGYGEGSFVVVRGRKNPNETVIRLD